MRNGSKRTKALKYPNVRRVDTWDGKGAILVPLVGKHARGRWCSLDPDDHATLSKRFANVDHFWLYAHSGDQFVGQRLRAHDRTAAGTARPVVNLARFILGAGPEQWVKYGRWGNLDLRRSNIRLVAMRRSEGPTALRANTKASKAAATE